MYAYSQVDTTVRRKLEEMLKTWREPVPGSLSTTPVFPFSATQSIIDALNRLKVSTGTPRMPQHGQSAPRATSTQPFRPTPTTQPAAQYTQQFPPHSTPTPLPHHLAQPPRSPVSLIHGDAAIRFG